LAQDPGRFLLHVPSSTAGELVRCGALDGRGVAVWSMWDGYLHEPSGRKLQGTLDAAGIPLRQIHTSGHASVADLRRLVAGLAPRRVVPIHSEAGDRFAELFPDVERHADGDWWEV
ncbi:MAG: MBL fold metallo-hydrolase RNA specificity domain-containing protein, partial [Actinomycetota bacterium]